MYDAVLTAEEEVYFDSWENKEEAEKAKKVLIKLKPQQSLLDVIVNNIQNVWYD